jgi:hypothetical protein
MGSEERQPEISIDNASEATRFEYPPHLFGRLDGLSRVDERRWE